jgi:hypothetical protein
VQHVATCITVTYFNNSGTGTGLGVWLLNGNVGGTGTLLSWNLAAPSGSSNSVNLCDLNVVGAADTPMTLEAYETSSAEVRVNLVGYDAQ